MKLIYRYFAIKSSIEIFIPFEFLPANNSTEILWIESLHVERNKVSTFINMMENYLKTTVRFTND